MTAKEPAMRFLFKLFLYLIGLIIILALGGDAPIQEQLKTLGAR